MQSGTYEAEKRPAGLNYLHNISDHKDPRHYLLPVTNCVEMVAQSPAQVVGPDYRPEGQKPTATVSTEVSYDNVHILPQTPQLIALLT